MVSLVVTGKFGKTSKSLKILCKGLKIRFWIFFNDAHSEKLQEQFNTSIYKNRILLPLIELFNMLIQAIKDT